MKLKPNDLVKPSAGGALVGGFGEKRCSPSTQTSSGSSLSTAQPSLSRLLSGSCRGQPPAQHGDTAASKQAVCTHLRCQASHQPSSATGSLVYSSDQAHRDLCGISRVGEPAAPRAAPAPATISLLDRQVLAQAGSFLGRKAQGVPGLRCLGINN